MKDLWTEEGGTKAVTRPQPAKVKVVSDSGEEKSWELPLRSVPEDRVGPRRRKAPVVKPNARPAVAVPHPGQSYFPEETFHKDAVAYAVHQLEKKKKEHEKFMKSISPPVVKKGQKTYRGSLNDDKTWEEEPVQDGAVLRSKKREMKRIKKLHEQKKKKGKKGQAKKVTKLEADKLRRQALRHKGHPSLNKIEKQFDKLEEVVRQVERKQLRNKRNAEKKKEARKENLKIAKFGRHIFTPQVLDVTPTDKLSDKLLHVKGGAVHPIMDRIKSLEERNLVPARMRHTYNKRKILKPKGEVMIRREPMGKVPESRD